MGALTADRNTLFTEPLIEAYPVAASTTIYKGSLVMLSATGYAIPGADTINCVFVGVSQENVNNSSGGDGDKTVLIKRVGCFKFGFGGTAALTDVGVPAYLVDDQTVDLAAITTNDIKAGVISQVDVSANEVFIDVGKV